MVEAYMPRGHKFFYYVDEKQMTSERHKATRFKNQYLAGHAKRHCLRHAPRGIEWFRVCPA